MGVIDCAMRRIGSCTSWHGKLLIDDLEFEFGCHLPLVALVLASSNGLAQDLPHSDVLFSLRKEAEDVQ